MEQVSTLLSSYDVVLKHSLKMFQDYRYDACSEENWSEMIQQLMDELELIQQKGTALLSDARRPLGNTYAIPHLRQFINSALSLHRLLIGTQLKRIICHRLQLQHHLPHDLFFNLRFQYWSSILETT